ncbi:MAG: methyltransferase domain-containing protein, partial [Gammaproteobacteria bacterium]
MARRTRSTLAEQADRFRLYEQSVQCVEAEIDFVEETFKNLRGRPAFILREDFCGTASACCEWVRRHRSKRAIGVDIDPEVLNWGARHNQSALVPSARKRLSLVSSDVLKVKAERVDCVLAMNFSYWLFKERKTMRRYFRHVHAGLVEDGIFFLDAYGGY